MEKKEDVIKETEREQENEIKDDNEDIDLTMDKE